MRRLLAVPAVLLFALAACTDEGTSGEEPPVDTAEVESSPESEDTSPVEIDLDEAEGACPFIDSELLDSITGEEFRFASGGPGEDAGEDAPPQQTCVIQTGEAAYPDLTLFVIPTEASVETYEDQLLEAAEPLDGLGESAYWIVHTEDTGAGPALEMGWYDGGTIFELRYTTPVDTDPALVEDLLAGFTELATGIAAEQADAAE